MIQGIMLNEHRDIEIRKLPIHQQRKLVHILEQQQNGWRDLMAVIPKECEEGNPAKYNTEHMELIERAGILQRRECSEILLEEWGISGKCRPTVSFLLKCLIKAELYRAADYVAVELLDEPPPTRPKHGPAARVRCPTESLEPSAPPASLLAHKAPNATSDEFRGPPVAHGAPTAVPEEKSDPPEVHGAPIATPVESNEPPQAHGAPEVSSEESNYPPEAHGAPTATAEDSSNSGTVRLSYAALSAATKAFNDEHVVGIGGWGSVFQGTLPNLGAVAIKRLHVNGVPGDPVVQFRNEMQTLTGLSHPNLLQLLGYSDDGPDLCLVYRFMKNGSLLDRLACKGGTAALGWQTRLDIAVGSARGLAHLHEGLPSPMVHRDVKSANILLDENNVPKLGDFGLVRLSSGGQTGGTGSTAVTTTVIGTSAYMAPEAHCGEISIKMDIFSFGVVLLELITGLSPLDESREDYDLVTHIMSNADNVTGQVDRKAGVWPEALVSELFELAFKCLESKRQRPAIGQVLQTLEHLF